MSRHRVGLALPVGMRGEVAVGGQSQSTHHLNPGSRRRLLTLDTKKDLFGSTRGFTSRIILVVERAVRECPTHLGNRGVGWANHNSPCGNIRGAVRRPAEDRPRRGGRAVPQQHHQPTRRVRAMDVDLCFRSTTPCSGDGNSRAAATLPDSRDSLVPAHDVCGPRADRHRCDSRDGCRPYWRRRRGRACEGDRRRSTSELGTTVEPERIVRIPGVAVRQLQDRT